MTTAQAFTGNWSTTWREHPAMAWMENYTRTIIDAKAWSTPVLEYHTVDFSLQKPDGTLIEGADAAYAAAEAMYAPLAQTLHEPVIGMVSEVEGGWQMIGHANLFANFAGSDGKGPHKSEDGSSWDVKVPSAFWFEYQKQDGAVDGIALRRTRIFSNEAPLMMGMLQRGIMKPSDLGL